MDELPRRKRIGLKNKSLLTLVDVRSNQRLLFASLASSAFLIYLDPGHTFNKVRTLVGAQIGADVIDLLSTTLLGPDYLSGGVAMARVIMATILLDAMHPPAVSTALSFELNGSGESNLILLGLAVAITALLVVLQRMAMWLLQRSQSH